MAGHDPKDPASADLPSKDYDRGLDRSIKGLRIGFLRHFHETDMQASEAIRLALEEAAKVFRGLGAEVRDVTLPSLQDWTACGMVIMMSEAYALHEPWLKTRMGEYGEYFRDRVLFGAFLRNSDYVEAQRMRRELCAAYAATMRDCDLLLCAITPRPAQLFEEMSKMSSFELPSAGYPFNVTGAPALALRAGFSNEGLPLGMQLAGRPFEDELVLRAGHAYERATAWSQRRPPEMLSAVPSATSSAAR
jgi:aspartyl-tRNA(Asn)/glutamyl-tRNA(Gln) amidotransferase subunit A